jgi:23S rRNA pseudouridine1911/1915/1917 synthase
VRKLDLLATRADEGERLDRYIAKRGGIARCEARRLLDRGAVWIDGKRVKIASRPVNEGQRVLVVIEESGRGEPQAVALGDERILYEDPHLIAVDKPPFVPAQATLASDRHSLLAIVTTRVGRPVGLVHRLDLETTGVTVFGKTRPATVALAAAFQEGLAKKRYLCVAWGSLPDEGRTAVPLSPDVRRWGRFRARENGKLKAATGFRVLARKGSLLLVEALPETGRTHQIRVHLSNLGAPLVGDSLYGGPPSLEGPEGTTKVERFLLHARTLELPHPATKEPLKIEAPVPRDLAEAAKVIGVEL